MDITTSKHEIFREKSCLDIVPTIEKKIDCVIADPPYSEYDLINAAIPMCREKCSGPSFFLCMQKMYTI